MSKLFFGNNTATPVLDVKTNYVPGLGIDEQAFANGTIAVNDVVIKNVAPSNTYSVINQWKSSAQDVNQQVAYGHGTSTSGIFSSAFGSNTYANAYSVALGSRANAAGSGIGYATAVGVFAKATQYSVAIGAYANDVNSSSRKGTIAIGYNTDTGNSHSTIVIGYNSKANNNNDTYPSIIIGNDIDLSNTSSAIGSVFISSKEKINGNDEQTVEARRTVGQFSVAIGYDAGGDKSVYSAADIVAIGGTARTKYQQGVAIGYAAQAEGNANIAIGAVAIAQTRNAEQGNEENSSIAIGKEARALGSNCFAIGWASRAFNQHSIAIGREARAGAENQDYYSAIAIGSYAIAGASNTIQLGSGTNNEEYTLQVGGSKLFNYQTGLIPLTAISAYHPANGQVLYYDGTAGELKWKDVGQGGGGGGSYNLPVASKTSLGGVKVGNGLNITLDGTLSVQSSSSDIEWGKIKGKLKNQTDLQSALDSKQKVIQYTTMPEATASRDGEVAQYIGEEDTLYKPGQFYQCTEDDYPTATCTSDTQWANLEVDAWMFANFISKYFYNSDLQGVPSKNYRIEYVNQFDGNGWILYENETSVYVKDIYKMGITAEGATPELGDCVYVQLYMHSSEGYAWRKLLVDAQVSVNNTLTSTSTKQALSANQGRVLNDKIEQLSGISHFLAMWDTNTGIARYLNAGYVYESGDYFIIATIAPDDPELSFVSTTSEATFTIDEQDGAEAFKICMSSEFNEPETGDYTFEITQVGAGVRDTQIEWTEDRRTFVFLSSIGISSFSGTFQVGDTITLHYVSDVINYKPAGTTYPGDTPASREITDDPVQISDMYFYDGAHWILLQSSARQIAVDEQLDNTSRNPVENRVVTNALEGKLDADSTEGLYATNDEGETQKLSVGSGLAINNGELVNTRTGGTWGQITGDIESQTDLVNYVASHGGGGSSLQLSDVFIKNKNLCEKDGIDEGEMIRYKGGYSDIFFKISSDYDSLKNARNDLYITIARNANTNNARRVSKMTVLDDCNRFKTNKKFYCWKSLGSGNGSYEWDSDNYEWNWIGSYPKQTEYVYFYVEEDYADQYEMQNDNPVIFTVPTANTQLDKGGWGTNFNELYAWGSLNDFDDPDYERCPQYDIDSVVSLYSNFSSSQHSPEYGYGNVVKNEFTKMECRVYSGPGGKFYFWCDDWTDSSANVYVAAEYDGEEHMPVSNTVPNFMGDLIDWTTVDILEEDFIFVEKRSDLDYYYYEGSKNGFRNVIDKLRLSTQDFPDQEDSVGQFDTNWNSYWLDYPIRPVRLADCKIYAYKLPYAEGDEDLARKYVSLVKKAWSFDEIEADEDLKHLIQNQDDLIFVLPYDTSYIWLRLFGWQKGVYYRKGTWDSETFAEPWDRHDLGMCIRKNTQQWQATNIKMFGARRLNDNTCRNEKGKFFQRLQFNLTTGSDLSKHKPSNLHPLNKLLWINGLSTQGLVDQVK